MPPERLVYDATWNGIPAGTAVMELTESGTGYLAVNTITSKGLVAAFFHIEDRTESVVSRAWKPRLFRSSINEGKHHSHREVAFDFEKLQVESRDLRKKKSKQDRISADTYDSLSAIYFLRSATLSPGHAVLFDIYDSLRLWNVEARVVRRQELETPLGRFQTLLVQTRLTANGIPSPVGATTFWFTDDARHLPVRMKTKIRVGEITLTLKQHSAQ